MDVVTELFLIAALSLPSPWHTHRIAASSEQDRLIEWLRKNDPDAEVFIHPNPQRDKLKNDGWERVPFTYKWQEIWIKRKPRSDRRAS